ncbi:2-oxoglutarate dehydrogenase, E2 component, dihydrolipoamide succinyltransferase [Arachnia propionica]|uniref:Dihydrolipoamide acetyltransferase component of pyruvate dehydrogenase complex n=1 Tax=Arachnia propionica TaxID=1750 RepID=A0AB37HX38_9ACTN|nr:2-oxoglutarate dehydrogenase, E2 component, dihydrolipoamide succinyltransferase [Arachnia propionica]AFN47015.1 2-oxoglutarate dehydrogenase, E2 component, dihydrolipoamide succinyltransferase [Arachnia propionica F0230a]QCT38293.1 2-oxoglutarate dehydrogenase, E2 component, dihydrolipoamide succinyltransferase [Arachnia propionica]QUC12120.1 2-oxoglutarate dehydrogenase, E2 component, dihydrolipoamide succinyltransferase [Arachnia propionica]RPA18923.1 2-oxoglutarate dehydrogenase, E2 comp
MSTEVTLPALGESVTEGTISRWLKAVGETVEVDEPLLEVSTDKVDTEIPSPVAGTLLEIRFNEDDVAEVGAVLAVIGEASEAPAPQAAPAPQPVAEAAPAPAPAPAPAAPPAPATPQAVPAGNATEVVLPVLGESVTEGTVSRWLKAVGETVEVDEPLLEVSTDKVDTEIPSPVAGTLLEIRVAEDETAAVGAVLALVGDAAVAPPAPAPAAPPAPAVTAPAAAPTAPAASVMARRASADEGVYVTPLVRKLAAEHGVSLSSVQGTGVGGRIRKQDILDAAEAAKKAASAPAPTAAAVASAPATAAPQVAAVSEEAAKLRGTTEKLSRMRKVIAERMTESLRVASQLTATVEVDVTAISKLRRAAKDEFKKREGASLSYLPFITKATIEALKAMPALNASADFEAGTVTYASQENIGIAVDTDRGLMVPVIQDAGDLNLAGLAKRIGDLAARTRAGKVGPDELSGGTFTITNYGSAGTLFDTPIINLPQVAILGTGALVKRPVVVTDALGGDTIAIRDMMYLSLTYDHRLIDGAKAARFLSLIKARLEAGDFAGDLGL